MIPKIPIHQLNHFTLRETVSDAGQATLISSKIAAMTPAYKRTIKIEYDRLVADSELPPGLINPTTKTLKEECLKKLKNGLRKEDTRVLMDFLKETNPDNIEKKMSSYHADNFKTAWKFMKGQTAEPNYKVVELVAWLIDYPDRPYSSKRVYDTERNLAENNSIRIEQLSNKKPIEKNTSIATPDTDPAIEPVSKQPVPAHRLFGSISPNYILVAFVFLTVIGLLLYNLGKQPGIQSNSFLANSCMYWAFDHYEASPCDRKIEGVLLIALDSIKLNNFRRITNPDTITYASIGKLWYYKPKIDSVEFYTAEGFHPKMHNRRLKPLTKYMIDKYVLKKEE